MGVAGAAGAAFTIGGGAFFASGLLMGSFLVGEWASCFCFPPFPLQVVVPAVLLVCFPPFPLQVKLSVVPGVLLVSAGGCCSGCAVLIPPCPASLTAGLAAGASGTARLGSSAEGSWVASGATDWSVQVTRFSFGACC